MELRSAISLLEDSQEFRKWKSKNKSSYFSNAFRMFQDQHDEWQLGFYDRSSDQITSFMVSPQSISIRTPEEVFKREETEIKELSIPDNALSTRDILQSAQQFQQKNYPKDASMKVIAMLQHLAPHGNVWNITYVTQAFNTLNFKVHPVSGEIIDHKLSSIFSFRQK